MSREPTQGCDLRSPPEIARRIESAAEVRVRAGLLRQFVLAILAGAFIAAGANAFTAAMVGAPAGGLPRVVGGMGFCLGLILVVVAGAELFTGNALQVAACLSRRIKATELLRSWLVVYAGNIVGSVAAAAIVFGSGQADMHGGQAGRLMVAIAAGKLGYTFLEAFLLGVLCNALVCLAVCMAAAGRSVVDKVAAIVPPITVFVLAGFEHSVANMYFVPLGLLIDGGATPELTCAAFLWRNLLPVTLGNIVGGSLLVGAAYWLAYLRGNRDN
ncbi:MAG: formate/nitrite transporter family protein [Planctomycetes bacterium]|nr:formate/nitrite transporter family protein [Planctomycetota bacterium]